jgi:hypothetical protein
VLGLLLLLFAFGMIDLDNELKTNAWFTLVYQKGRSLHVCKDREKSIYSFIRIIIV